MQEVLEGVLVTGATGLIGFHVARELAADKRFKTVCIVRRGADSRKADALRRLDVGIEEGSFLDPDTLGRIFESYAIRYVVHLAALRGGGAGTREDYARVNVAGTEGLLKLSVARGVRRFIYCSSVGVFGTIPKQLPAGEDTPLNGDNLYHKSKIEAEKRVTDYISRGLDARIIRPTITYGPEEEGFPTTLVKMVRDRRFVLCGGDVRIHLLDARRLAAFVRLLLSRGRLPRDIFIVADEAPISLKKIVDRIHRHFHGVPYPRYLKMPGFVFKAAAFFFGVLRHEKWLTRTLLISRSWHYDLSATVAAVPEFVPARTGDNFIEAMCAGR